MTPHRHSIYCILPPHVLREVAEHASGPMQQAAQATLTLDQAIRLSRVNMMAQTTPTKKPWAKRSRPWIIRWIPGIGVRTPEQRRTIFTALGQETLPGDIARREGAATTGDAAVDEAYDGLGATFDFYWQVLKRASVDDKNLPLNATVHYGQGYDNAFWNGEQMVFGDGDGQIFNRFTVALDVIGHELTHGVTQYTAQLDYQDQAGALNESISDVFGSLIKQYKLGQSAASADWLIGQGLFTASVNGAALRSMKAPGTAYDDPVLGKDPQPGDMSGYVYTAEDGGGVHINSGIPNHAFYLVATKIGGNAWEAPGHIWYETLRSPSLRSNADFQAFATLTAETAGRLYGANGREQQAVVESWAEVGVRVGVPVPAR